MIVCYNDGRIKLKRDKDARDMGLLPSSGNKYHAVRKWAIRQRVRKE